jgi:hypothetical protein
MIIVEGYRGLSHDGGVAIYSDGQIISLAAERIDRTKHSLEPRQTYDFLRKRLRLTFEDEFLGLLRKHGIRLIPGTCSVDVSRLRRFPLALNFSQTCRSGLTHFAPPALYIQNSQTSIYPTLSGRNKARAKIGAR